MSFELSEEELAIKQAIRDFARKEFAPLMPIIEEENELPPIVWEKLRELKVIALPFKEEYGGVGSTFTSFILAVEEIGQVAPVIANLPMQNVMTSLALNRFGTDDQKKKYLIPLISGELRACWAFTEPATGSDPSAFETKAVLNGNEYIINGNKRFISGVFNADIATIFAKTRDGRIGAFVTETNRSGFTPGRREQLMGFKGLPVGDLILEDFPIPKEDVLGKDDEGFKVLLEIEAESRIRSAALSVGMAQAALDEAVKYSKERVQRGNPISKFLSIKWQLAEMAMNVEAARNLVYRCAYLRDQGKKIRKDSAIAKLFASTKAREVASMSLQVHGCYGYTKDFPIERIYRDVKLNEVAGGNADLQRVIIANELLR